MIFIILRIWVMELVAYFFFYKTGGRFILKEYPFS